MSDAATAKNILFLRAVAGLAWADGRIDPAERAFIKQLIERMSLSQKDRQRLDKMLEKPMPANDAQRLLRDLARGVFTVQERQQLLQTLRDLAAADGDFSVEERDFIRRLELGVKSSAAIARVFSEKSDDDEKEQKA